MVDYRQIKLKLGMDALDIPINTENYRYICNIIYLAEQRGVYISTSSVLYDPKSKVAYSPFIGGERGENCSNLLTNIREIQQSLEMGENIFENFALDKNSLRKLNELKREIKSIGIENLLLKINQREKVA